MSKGAWSKAARWPGNRGMREHYILQTSYGGSVNRAANPSIDLCVMKSNSKCKNWILSITHIFWLVHRTCIHDIIHADMINWEFKAAYSMSLSHGVPWGEDFTTHGYLSDIPLSKSVVWVFESFHWRLRVLFLSAFCFSMTPANELKKGSFVLPGSVSAGSEVLSMGKWTQH